MQPLALVLHATGTNRDLEAAQALELAGARPEVVPLNQLRSGARRWADYALLVIPGGFSYADALGAGRLLALDLRSYFADEVQRFVDSGKPVIGICNGFQALVKAGLLPYDTEVRGSGSEVRGSGSEVRGSGSDVRGRASEDRGRATLTFNESGRFECRWVTLLPSSQRCAWTAGLDEPIYCPVAHGEGSFLLAEAAQLSRLRAGDQIALTYIRPDGSPAAGAYPHNPNGSLADIAGVCNPPGNVLGLMPHPEDHIFAHQHPRWTRGERGGLGLRLFQNGVRHAAQH